ncbi:MAG: 50S ribosomal protein L23 [Candidatus Yanofskybacteria bacterium]|nr:50S ribosomal protein L23 [Candidatus Yanofskybacteria bacterium]
MALNLFGKKKQPKKETLEPQVTEASEVATPAIAAPASSVLKRYYVSEKSSRGFALNQYTFEVDRRATKTDVRDAVERGYKVDVVSVNMIRLPKKTVSLGRHRGTKGGIKKAIVTLKNGQSIAQAQP